MEGRGGGELTALRHYMKAIVRTWIFVDFQISFHSQFLSYILPHVIAPCLFSLSLTRSAHTNTTPTYPPTHLAEYLPWHQKRQPSRCRDSREPQQRHALPSHAQKENGVGQGHATLSPVLFGRWECDGAEGVAEGARWVKGCVGGWVCGCEGLWVWKVKWDRRGVNYFIIQRIWVAKTQGPAIWSHPFISNAGNIFLNSFFDFNFLKHLNWNFS